MSWATWNPYDKAASATLSNGNLTLSANASNACRATVGASTTKRKFEVTIASTHATDSQFAIGLGKAAATLAGYVGSDDYGWAIGPGFKYHSGAATAYGSSYNSAVVTVLWDPSAGTLEFKVNNVSLGVAFTGVTGVLYPMASGVSASAWGTITINTGATAFVYSDPDYIGWPEPSAYEGSLLPLLEDVLDYGVLPRAWALAGNAALIADASATACVSLDGAGDYIALTSADATQFVPGTAPFVGRAIFKIASPPASYYVLQDFFTSGQLGHQLRVTSSGYLQWWDSAARLTGTVNVCDNQWRVVEWGRDAAGTLRFYVGVVGTGNTMIADGTVGHSSNLSCNTGQHSWGAQVANRDSSMDLVGKLAGVQFVVGAGPHTSAGFAVPDYHFGIALEEAEPAPDPDPGATLTGSNAMLSWVNRMPEATLSGGSFSVSLPRDNIKNSQRTKVARTSDATESSTLVVGDLGSDQYIWVFGMFGTNASPLAAYRLRLFEDSGLTTTLYDSGIVTLFGGFYTDIEWEDNRFWFGAPLDEEMDYIPRDFVHVLSQRTLARYFKFEIFDEDNADGYIDMGAGWIGDAWQPEKNMAFGNALGHEDLSTIGAAPSGVEYATERELRRTMSFELPRLTEAEAMQKVWMLQRIAKTINPLVVVRTPQDPSSFPRTAVRGRLSKANPITNPFVLNHANAFQLQELL